MTNDELQQRVRELSERLETLETAHAERGDTIARLRAHCEEAGRAIRAFQQALTALGKLPGQVNATAALVERHQHQLERITGAPAGAREIQ